jgi:hypothetical protein
MHNKKSQRMLRTAAFGVVRQRELMRYLSLIFIFIFTSANGETLIKVFRESEMLLPKHCYLIVRGGVENDFICPSPTDRFRSITFPLVEDVSEQAMEEDASKINGSAEEEGFDFRIVSVKSALIDSKKHYLLSWELNGIISYSYTICDQRSCIEISANEFSFIENLISQVSLQVINVQ